MLLTMDVGNTNISCGIFDDDQKLVTTFRLTTKQQRTPDEISLQLHSIMEVRNVQDSDIDKVAISSVVPKMNDDLACAVRNCFGVEPFFINAACKMNLSLPSTEPGSIGADLLVDVVAAYERYQGEVLVVDFGTATKFLYIAPEGAFKYCVIAPGLEMTANTLWQSTAQLPQVELVKPETVLTANTVECMRAGIVYGYIGLTEKIIDQFKTEIGHDFPVLATGGLGRIITPETDKIDQYDPNLAYYGMQYLFERNQ